MRSFLLLASASLGLVLGGCAADPAPQANGFNVELWFDAPEGLVVGATKEVKVQRIEAQYSRCQSASTVCDPRASEPITLVSASCDDGACSVESSESRDGALVLETTGTKEGPTTLRVRVKNVSTGEVLEDAYPIVVKLPQSPVEHRFGARR